jgi:hypothetical protein
MQEHTNNSNKNMHNSSTMQTQENISTTDNSSETLNTRNYGKLSANKFGQVAQGVGTRITKEEATHIINFIPKDHIPKHRMKDVTYGSFNCDYKPNMEEKWRTRLTAGGDRINYPFNCSTPTADMTLLKIIINSTISTKGAQCMMIDHSNFYLKTPIA